MFNLKLFLMEDFKRRLFEEYLELSLKTNKNLCFIKNNPKFKELSWGEQCLQWRQYFAQKDYMEALGARIYNLTSTAERHIVRLNIEKRFLDIYQGGAISFYGKDETKEFTCIENICGGEIAANGQMTGIHTDMCILYAMIMDAGVYDNGEVKYVAHEPETKPQLEDIGNVPCEMSEEDLREVHQAGGEKPTKADPYSREFQDARD